MRGSVFVVAAPSGGGKTSLVKALVRDIADIVVSTSHTTREQRPGEVDGVDYFFIDEPAFEAMVAEEAFVEHARVFGHYYGTSVAEIRERLANGLDVVLDIDWQGAAQIRRLFPGAVTVFVIPPSLTVLRERLEKRGRDNEAVIDSRMEQARAEMQHFSEFDYLIVNDVFEEASEALKAIVMSERHRVARQAMSHRKLLSTLLS
ncbi:guanylate kinase [Legionella geestiana]|nr:guanylate kinase [Legionella geestiana]QBS12043.1 guanylate kinase [Legionella geestiana]QDQ40347.1 guanylate kinase [Legionella geestiana]